MTTGDKKNRKKRGHVSAGKKPNLTSPISLHFYTLESMAKKQEKPKTEAPPPPTTTMEENQSEKLANLKSLNIILMKETLQRREQVHSLEMEIDQLKKQGVQDQWVEKLKDEMWREKDTLRGLLEEKRRELEEVGGDFRRFREDAGKEIVEKGGEIDWLRSVVGDLEKRVVDGKSETERIGVERDALLEEKSGLERKVEELGREIEDAEVRKIERNGEIQKLHKLLGGLEAELVSERNSRQVDNDEFRKSLGVSEEEFERLKLHVIEIEKCNSATEEELGKLRSERRELMQERMERERCMQAVVKEKEGIERNLAESGNLVEVLRSEVENLGGEKEEVEKKRGNLIVRIAYLEKEVDELRATVCDLQCKETELEKRNGEELEKLLQMRAEFDALVEEKSVIEKNFELLACEKASALSSLKATLLVLEREKKKIDELSREKVEIETINSNQKIEILNLLEWGSVLKASVSALEESNRKQVEMKTQIQSEVQRYKDVLESVTHERDNVRDEATVKKKEEERLRSEVSALEKRAGETLKELEVVRTDYGSLCNEIKEMKSQISMLTEERGVLQIKLGKAEDGVKDLQGKLKSSKIYTGQTLLMLKNTMEMVRRLEVVEMDGKEDMAVSEHKMDEEIQPFAAELEAIKKAFKNKNGKVEDLNRQCECLKVSMVEAQKKKKLWALLSSATAILATAAASMAYVARVR